MKKKRNGLRLFSSDLDGTLLGNPDSTERFKHFWGSIPNSKRPVLCYNTGRFKEEVDEFVYEGVLPEYDYLISAVGTRIYEGSTGRELIRFREKLNKGWDIEQVTQTMYQIEGIKRQPEAYQNTHKSSWFLPEDTDIEKRLSWIKKKLESNHLDVNIIYSSGRDLDILPAAAGKGSALKWMCTALDIPLDEAIVAGNTGNDTGMFMIEKVKGIMVANAKPELQEAVKNLPIFRASRNAGDGVIQGLQHYGVKPMTQEKVLTEA